MKFILLLENGHIAEKNINIPKASLKKEPSKIFTTGFCKKNFESVGSGKVHFGKGWTYNNHKYIPVGYTTPNENEDVTIPPPFICSIRF